MLAFILNVIFIQYSISHLLQNIYSTLQFNNNLSSVYSSFNLSPSIEHLICFQFVDELMLINIFMQELFTLPNCLFEIDPQI